jgi:signal transduction histidine kinase
VIESKHQQVTIDVANAASHASADPAKLHDIVRNLVENAVNYSSDGAEIRSKGRDRMGATPSRFWTRARESLLTI